MGSELAQLWLVEETVLVGVEQLEYTAGLYTINILRYQ
jgi:hypothetical protein